MKSRLPLMRLDLLFLSPPAEGFILGEKQLSLSYEDDKGRYIWRQGKTERVKCFG